MALSARKCETLTKAGKHYDGGGLYLNVTAKGKKQWRYEYAFEGKRSTASFGAYPSVSLAEAKAPTA